MLRLVPQTLPENKTSSGDRVIAACNKAIESTKEAIEAGRPPLGVAILFLEQYPDGGSGPTWIVQNLSQLEAVGLMQHAICDIVELGLQTGSDVVPDDCA